MKKLIVLFLLVCGNMLFAIKSNNFVESSDTQGGSLGGEYNIVQVDCDASACYLICIGGGETPCNWANADYICDCNFTASNSQDMFDYAHIQMNLNVLSGNYTSNIIPHTGTKFYRSVSWNQDSSGIRVINYTLGED